ncbi:MAG: DUF3298 domain-containing protein [Alphaproteobacteria bacterium]|nr:DUF3298 domain-containing protein [Alphaproteobacteria bacterium]
MAFGAAAQTGPGFDCAKATTAVEKAICGDAEAAAADRKMADAYARLLASLTLPAARSHLQRDQTAWLSDRQRACAPAREKARDVMTCLRELTAARAEHLVGLPGGEDYPFVGERRLIERGRRGGVAYDIAVSYAVFELPGVDFAQPNAAIRDWVDKNAAYARPPTDATGGGPDIGWYLEGGHDVLVATRGLVTVAAYWSIYSGGAHPNHGRTAWQVDVVRGRLLSLEDLFEPSSGWPDAITALVRADLKKQFEERPGNDEALEPAALRKAVIETRRWIFAKDKVTLTFDPYEVGPYAAGPYEVDLSYAQLARYLRKAGPLAGKAR